MSQVTRTVILASIEAPSTCVQIVESNNFQFYTSYAVASDFTLNSNVTPRTITGAGNTKIVERHLETTNVLWCDGHVKAMKLENLARAVPNADGNILTYFTIGADPD